MNWKNRINTKYIIFISLLYLVTTSNLLHSQNSFVLKLNTGLPVITNPHFGIGKYFTDFSADKQILKNGFIGMGFTYCNVDIKPTRDLFTYDRKMCTPYILIGKSLNLKNDMIRLSPQLRVGYSFYTYELNEFSAKTQSDAGWTVAPGIELQYKLKDNIFFTVNLLYNHIFNSFENDIKFPIPATYITIQDKYINNYCIGIGLAMKI